MFLFCFLQPLLCDYVPLENETEKEMCRGGKGGSHTSENEAEEGFALLPETWRNVCLNCFKWRGNALCIFSLIVQRRLSPPVTSSEDRPVGFDHTLVLISHTQTHSKRAFIMLCSFKITATGCTCNKTFTYTCVCVVGIPLLNMDVSEISWSNLLIRELRRAAIYERRNI